LLKYETC